MPKPENIVPHKFKKGQSGNPKGRPRKLISHINAGLKDEGYRPATNEEIREAYLTLINLPLSKIQEISSTKNDDYPLLYKLTAKEMMGKRGLEMMEKVLDRAIGKAQQHIDHTSKGEQITINYKNYTDEELRLIAELQRKGGVGKA